MCTSHVYPVGFADADDAKCGPRRRQQSASLKIIRSLSATLQFSYVQETLLYNLFGL